MKYVHIEFADPQIRACDHLDDILKAVQNAKINLWQRHHVSLGQPVTCWPNIYIPIGINVDSDFKIGNHLKGISAYLLDKCDFDYSGYLVGNRLLNYRLFDTMIAPHTSSPVKMTIKQIEDILGYQICIVAES